LTGVVADKTLAAASQSPSLGVPMKFVLRIALLVVAFAFGAQAAELNFKPFHANGIYAVGDQVGWTVTPAAGATPAPDYTYTVKTNERDTIASGRFDLSSGSATITVSVDRPEMLYVTVDRAAAPQPDAADAAKVNDSLKALLAENDPSIKSVLDKYPGLCLITAPCAEQIPAPAPETHLAVLGAAVAPTMLEPTAARPADFDSFWAGKLAALRKIPINPVLTVVPTTQPGVKLYRFRLDSLGSHVQGYVALPKGKGPFPVLVIYQWAGVYVLDPSWATNRAAQGWLAVNVDSHDMLPTEATAPKNYYELGNTSRETSYFLNMYLRDTRALDWARTLPHWDRRTLVVTGTSMGGQQSLVIAGLNPGKITAIVVNEPSGADSNAELHGRAAGYPNWAVNDPIVAQTALYFDTVNFAPRITAPTLAAVGFLDRTCPPAGVWTVLNRITSPKEVVAMVESDHNHITPEKQSAYLLRSEQVLATLLVGRKFVPNDVLGK
jgi:cephalosporin-C deacetylase